ncbi:MAG: hypothetical protein A2Y25_01670 [Candidatus Melainabacteria bacterium GWF2_37_15]|nr:MAG: hypothetical protein A2Y25_01670 [Candidatus Melainabacteria bacterium GWF2_37_15]
MGNNTAIQLRHDTASNWTTDNPTMAAGEMGIETDTKRIKVGDGSTAWNSLSYYGVGASFKYGLYTLSSDQTSNISANNHIEFNTSHGSLGGLSTGSGQQNGIITLTGGKTYKITGAFLFRHSSAGATQVQVYDRTNSTYISGSCAVNSMNSSSNHSSVPVFIGIITPASNIDIEVRFTSISNTDMVLSGYTSHLSGYTHLLIEEYGGY